MRTRPQHAGSGHMSNGSALRLFPKRASYYDAVYDAIYDPYSGKDYKSESKRLLRFVKRHKRSNGGSLLDVPCGTGGHLCYLKTWFDAEGLDIDGKALAMARKVNPGIQFHRGNMLTFKLPKRFDVISCLSGAIGYMTTVTQLREAVRNMSRHLKAGGALIIEPWVTPRKFRGESLHVVLVNQPNLKLVRMGTSSIRDRTLIMNFHYLIATPKNTRYFSKSEKLGLFTHSEHLTSFGAAGLRVTYYKKGLTKRGLYVGVKA